jgi:predicted YcjX-like family ATPase
MLLGMSGSGRGKESPDGGHRARRFVLRFDQGGVHSFDVLEGEDPVEALKRHLGFFPGRVPESLQEQFYDPEHPRRFRYEERKELLSLAKEILSIG